jgi:hypothetical protein
VKKLMAFSALMLFAPLALAAGVSVEGLINVLVWLIVVGLIFWLLWWFIGYIGLPQPFDKVARVLIGLVAFLILIYLLLGILGPMPRLH